MRQHYQRPCHLFVLLLTKGSYLPSGLWRVSMVSPVLQPMVSNLSVQKKIELLANQGVWTVIRVAMMWPIKLPSSIVRANCCFLIKPPPGKSDISCFCFAFYFIAFPWFCAVNFPGLGVNYFGVVNFTFPSDKIHQNPHFVESLWLFYGTTLNNS